MRTQTIPFSRLRTADPDLALFALSVAILVLSEIVAVPLFAFACHILGG